MDFSTRTAAADAVKTDCVAVGVFAGGELATQARAIDTASKGALRAAVKSGDVTGKRGATVMLRCLPGVAASRVLLVGLAVRVAGTPSFTTTVEDSFCRFTCTVLRSSSFTTTSVR